jgi:excisionase family DNA binding protein
MPYSLHKILRCFDKSMTTTPKQFGALTPAEWLTAAEAAQYLKVKVRTLLLWVRQGKVKAFALSGTKRRVWRFRHGDLDAALLESSVLPSEAPSVCPEERTDQ